MRFAKVAFWCASVWGFLVLTPLYFMEGRIGREYPPAITHPEFYYGFVGVALAWQVAFAVIAIDPARYRLMMIPSAVEKFTYVAAVLVLYQQGRLPPTLLPFGASDLLLGVLFVVAFFKTRTTSP